MAVSNMTRVRHQWMSSHVRLCVTLSCLAGYQLLLNWQTLYTGTACPKALQALFSHNTVIWPLAFARVHSYNTYSTLCHAVYACDYKQATCHKSSLLIKQANQTQLPSCTTTALFDLPPKHVCTKDRNLPVKAELLPSVEPSLLPDLLRFELSLLYTRELCRETPLLFCHSQVALNLTSAMDAFVIKAVSHNTNQAFRMRRSMPAAS